MNTPLPIPPPDILGLDIGGTIVDDGYDRQLEIPKFVDLPPHHGAIAAIMRLRERFGRRLFIVSRINKVKDAVEALQWFDRHRFFRLTGLAMNNIHFCWKRHEKAAICQRLKITHFVDNRHDVLHHMEGVVPVRILFGPRNPGYEVKYPNWGGRYAQSWDEIAAFLLA